MGKEVAFTIESMKKDDIDQVLFIERASFSMPWSRNLFLSEFQSPLVSRLLVALSSAPERTVAGYIIFWLVADEMHILNLAVTPKLRGHGIARGLILAALRYASEQGVRRAFLEVRASNVTAQKLYSSIGFTGASVRREYYDLPLEDAVVMTLEQAAMDDLIKKMGE